MFADTQSTTKKHHRKASIQNGFVLASWNLVRCTKLCLERLLEPKCTVSVIHTLVKLEDVEGGGVHHARPVTPTLQLMDKQVHDLCD